MPEFCKFVRLNLISLKIPKGTGVPDRERSLAIVWRSTGQYSGCWATNHGQRKQSSPVWHRMVWWFSVASDVESNSCLTTNKLCVFGEVTEWMLTNYWFTSLLFLSIDCVPKQIWDKAKANHKLPLLRSL